jgi:hypothetical protein
MRAQVFTLPREGVDSNHLLVTPPAHEAQKKEEEINEVEIQ